jgi:hypothetical protein
VTLPSGRTATSIIVEGDLDCGEVRGRVGQVRREATFAEQLIRARDSHLVELAMRQTSSLARK